MRRRSAWGTRTAALGLAGALLSLVAAPGAAVAADQVDLGGTAVEASTNIGDATKVEAGLWSATLGASSAESTHYYRYQRTEADSTVYATVVATRTGDSEGLDLEILSNDDTTCWTASNRDSSVYGASGLPFGVGGMAGPDEAGDRESSCLGSDEVRISVTRSSTASSGGDLPYVLKVVEQVPLETGSVNELPAPTEVSTIDAADLTGDADQVEGGTSFDDAVALDSGTPVEQSLKVGEVRFFQLPVTWGQKLTVTAQAPALEEYLPEYDGSSPSLKVRIYDPSLNPVTTAGVADFDNDALMSSSESTTATNGIDPVTYLGRYEDSAYLAGQYWVGVNLYGDGVSEEDAIPIRLQADVEGDEAGVPQFTRDDPYLIAPGNWAEEPSGHASAEESDGSLVRRVGAGALAVAGLACLVIAGLRLRPRVH